MSPRRPVPKAAKKPKSGNRVRQWRERLLMSKAELAKEAGVSLLTVMRLEKGGDCRMSTKRKIIVALGLTVKDNAKVFGKRSR